MKILKNKTEGVVNSLSIKILARSENEAFARNCVASFLAYLNPSLDEINDVKTAISEAVTNCIVHGYEGRQTGNIDIDVLITKNKAIIEIADSGVGITDIEKAKEPFFTTKQNEQRSGMGFTVMESFMDEVVVESKLGVGTKVKLVKEFCEREGEPECFLTMKQQSC